MGRQLKIALVQQDTVWHEPAANLEKARAFVARAAKEGARVVAFTEMFASGFTMEAARFAETIPGPVSNALAAMAREHGVWIIGTQIEQHAPKPQNAAFAINPEGAIVATYRKIHPFSFGQENEHYVGGDAMPLFDLDGVKATLQICYDLRFPETFRWASAKGAELVFVPANWPARRAMHWSTLLAARAIENQMVVCGINRAGKDPGLEYPGLSAIHDPRGEVLAKGDATEQLVVASVDFDDVAAWRAQFPALRDRRPDVYSKLG